MEDTLQQAGMNEPQAKTYLYLLNNGQSAPPAIAQALTLTRSNAYKILEKLLELELISRAEVEGKFLYKAKDPTALLNIVAAEQSRVQRLESSVEEVLQELRRKYQQTTSENILHMYVGKDNVVAAHQTQAKTSHSLFAIGQQSDISKLGQEENEQTINPGMYTTPVAWTVSNDELLITSFKDQISAIRIKDEVIAQAFTELWHLLDRSLRKDPQYKKLAKQARRTA